MHTVVPSSRLRSNFAHAAEHGGALAHGLQADALLAAIGVGGSALRQVEAAAVVAHGHRQHVVASKRPQMSTRLAPE